MVPSDEAIAWARRADAWAEQPPGDEVARGGQGDQPASRWSEVAPTGRPGFPAEGVGWRTETAEWRAAEQTARWRQTTEWRSASGTHGWRSTTEAWQTGSGAEGFLPPADPPTRQQTAISGTAWPTPQNEGGVGGPAETPGGPAYDGTPSWQQSPTTPDRPVASEAGSWQQFPETTPPWQQPADGRPSWQQPADSPSRQQPADGRPSWQQFTGPPPAPWQQTTASGPMPWDQGQREQKPWEQPPVDPGPPGQRPWQQLVDPAPSRQQAAPDPAPAARDPYTGAWSGTIDDGRHLVREDDRAQWRRESAAGMAAPADVRPAGRRRAPEAGPGRSTSSGTGWSGRSEADNWAGHTDTGSMPMFQPPPVTDAPAWGTRAEAPSWRDDSTTSGWSGAPDQRRESERRRGEERSGEADRPSWQSDPTGRVRDAEVPNWRREAEPPSWQRGATPDNDTPSWQRGAAPENSTPSWQRDATPDNDTPSWQRGAAPDNDAPSWRRGVDEPRQIESGSWQTGGDTRRPETDVPSWQRDRAARPEAETSSWQTGPIADQPRGAGPGGPGPRRTDPTSWRRDADRPLEIEAPSWRRNLADDDTAGRSGRINGAAAGAAGWRSEADDTPSWRRDPADGDTRGRSRDRDDEPAGDWRDRSDSWRAEPDSGSWSRGDEPRTDGWRRPADQDPNGDGRGWRESGPGGDGRGWRESGPDSDGRGWRANGSDGNGRGWRDGGPETTGSWRREDDSPVDPWGQSAADTGVIPATWQQPVSDTGSWRSAPEGGDRPSNTGRRRSAQDRPGDQDRPGSRGRPGSQDRPGNHDRTYGLDQGLEPGSGTVGRRRAIESGSRAEAPVRRDDAPGRDETAARRDGVPAPRGDFRSAPGDAPDRLTRGPNRRNPDVPLGPEVWQQGSRPPREGTNWPAEDEPATQAHADWRRELRDEVRRDNPGDAVTEIRQRIDPGTWDSEPRDEAPRGTATYREGNTGDWRRDLAAASELAEGESRRYGTQDFIPFRPVGSAAVPAPPAGAPPAGAPPFNGAQASAPPFNGAQASAPPFNGGPTGGPREQLLVGNDEAAVRWQDPPDTQWPPRGATGGYQGGTTGGSYERRSVSSLPGSSGRQTNLLEPDEDEIEESTGGPLAAVGYTVIWYGVPVVLFVLYMLVLNGTQQAHALSTLAGAAPQFGLSLVLSMLVAVGLRWASGSWKAASVGLAAAVMGGGLATVLTSAITGNALN